MRYKRKRDECCFPLLLPRMQSIVTCSESNHPESKEVVFKDGCFQRNGRKLKGLTTGWVQNLFCPESAKKKRQLVYAPVDTSGIALSSVLPFTKPPPRASRKEQKEGEEKKRCTLSANMRKGRKRGEKLDELVGKLYECAKKGGFSLDQLSWSIVGAQAWKKTTCKLILSETDHPDTFKSIWTLVRSSKRCFPHPHLLFQKLHELQLTIVALQLPVYYQYILGTAVDIVCMHRQTGQFHIIEVKTGDGSTLLHPEYDPKTKLGAYMNTPLQTVTDCTLNKYFLQLLLTQECYKHTFSSLSTNLGKPYLIRISFYNCYHYHLPAVFIENKDKILNRLHHHL